MFNDVLFLRLLRTFEEFILSRSTTLSFGFLHDLRLNRVNFGWYDEGGADSHLLFRVFEQPVNCSSAFQHCRGSLALPFVRLRHLSSFRVDGDHLL
jgi:hypothetical protein